MNILTSLPSPDVNYFEVGAFQIRYYAILILIGIVLAIWMAAVRLKRNGVEAGIALDVAIYAVPIGIIGARFYHVLTHLNDYFGKPGVDPISIFGRAELRFMAVLSLERSVPGSQLEMLEYVS